MTIKGEVDIKNLNFNPQALRDFNKHIVGQKKPFKVEHLKEWFAGQKIHVIAKNYKGIKEVPSEIQGTPGMRIVDVLDRVWLVKREVAEGMIGDLLYGCRMDPKDPMTYEDARNCILDLRTRGYLDFSDSEGNLGEGAWSNIPITEIWFRLSDKFVSMLIADKV